MSSPPSLPGPVTAAAFLLSDQEEVGINVIPASWYKVRFDTTDILVIGPFVATPQYLPNNADPHRSPNPNPAMFGGHEAATPQARTPPPLIGSTTLTTGRLGKRQVRFEWVVEQARIQNPNIKIIVSQFYCSYTEGWDYAGLNTDALRDNYTTSVIALLQEYWNAKSRLGVSLRIDGYDVDYEYVWPQDTSNHSRGASSNMQPYAPAIWKQISDKAKNTTMAPVYITITPACNDPSTSPPYNNFLDGTGDHQDDAPVKDAYHINPPINLADVLSYIFIQGYDGGQGPHIYVDAIPHIKASQLIFGVSGETPRMDHLRSDPSKNTLDDVEVYYKQWCPVVGNKQFGGLWNWRLNSDDYAYEGYVQQAIHGIVNNKLLDPDLKKKVNNGWTYPDGRSDHRQDLINYNNGWPTTPMIYIRDEVGDIGLPTGGIWWQSPDIIVKASSVANPQTSFGYGSGNEASKLLADLTSAAHDSYVYVRVLNRGFAAANNVTATVWYSAPSTFTTPNAWHLIGTSASISVPNGNVLTVLPGILWSRDNTPSYGGHFCLLATITDDNANDKAPIIPSSFASETAYMQWVENNDHVAGCNMEIVPAPAPQHVSQIADGGPVQSAIGQGAETSKEISAQAFVADVISTDDDIPPDDNIAPSDDVSPDDGATTSLDETDDQEIIALVQKLKNTRLHTASVRIPGSIERDHTYRIETYSTLPDDPDSSVETSIPNTLADILGVPSSSMQPDPNSEDSVVIKIPPSGNFVLGKGVLPKDSIADCEVRMRAPPHVYNLEEGKHCVFRVRQFWEHSGKEKEIGRFTWHFARKHEVLVKT